jgi:hypothetical protein
MAMPFAQPFFVSPHAVTQFRARLAPQASADQIIWAIQAALQGRMVYPPRRPLAVSDRARMFTAIIQPPVPARDLPWPQVVTIYRWRDYLYRADGRPRRRSVHTGFR